jgi:hypothetical protein
MALPLTASFQMICQVNNYFTIARLKPVFHTSKCSEDTEHGEKTIEAPIFLIGQIKCLKMHRSATKMQNIQRRKYS